MKKILSILLMLALILSVAACGNKPADEEVNKDTVISQEEDKKEESKKEETKKDEDKKEDSEKEEDKKDNKKEESKPEVKPEVKPETTPETKPETTPEPEPETSESVATTLLGQFNSIASSGSALSIAEKLVANPVIAFAGGAMAVEPGYLTGLDNTEITGFKEGAMFAPMIGTIPFVGYVFTLDAGTNASDFIATLKSSANLRWNICTSADEMVAGSSGDKVFFVMSPISFEEE